MVQVVKKFFVNYEKEEAWLNKMAAKGLNLIQYSFGKYVFEVGSPGEYIYRIELLEQVPTHPESQAYIDFLKDTNVEYVDCYMRWVYFRKKASEGEFDLYSDYESKVKHYKRIIWLLGPLCILNLYMGLYNMGLAVSNFHRSEMSLVSGGTSILSFSVTLLLAVIIGTNVRKIYKLKKDKDIYQL